MDISTMSRKLYLMVLATICITDPGPEFAFTFLLVVILAAGVIS